MGWGEVGGWAGGDGGKTVIFDCGSRLYVCPKAKDCQPANHSVCVHVCVWLVCACVFKKPSKLV